jgi:hypothetical protein
MIKEKGSTLKRLEDQIQDFEQSLCETEGDVKLWRGLRKKSQKGHPVYPPRVPSKRKRTAGSQRARTNRQVIDEDSDDEEENGAPLNPDEIDAKVNNVCNQYNKVLSNVEDMERQAEALKEELINLGNKKNNLAEEAAALCVRRRNEVVKKAIRADFAAGIKEMDDYETQDDENFDPSVERRDYEVVARSLPVFCVSSKAAQLICRPKKRESQVSGFKTLADTEIPQLVDHALKLPEAGRAEARRRFLNEVRHLLGSLTIWCTACDEDLSSTQMSAEGQSYEMQFLKTEMSKLRKKIGLAIVAQKTELEEIVSKEFNSKSNTAIRHAANAVVDMVEKWPLKVEKGGRAIHPMTYRSVCRRGGEKTKAPTAFNFNEAILEPYLEKIVNGWEQAFSRSIPSALDKFVTTFNNLLRDFHSKMAARPELQKCKKSSMRIISKQVDTHSDSIVSTIKSMKTEIQSEQRQASRAFMPEIKKEMMNAYQLCGNEKGEKTKSPRRH